MRTTTAGQGTVQTKKLVPRAAYAARKSWGKQHLAEKSQKRIWRSCPECGRRTQLLLRGERVVFDGHHEPNLDRYCHSGSHLDSGISPEQFEKMLKPKRVQGQDPTQDIEAALRAA